MKTKLLTFFKSSNLYIFLLPVFFVLHGFSEYYNLIKIPKAFELTAYYFAGTIIVLLISKLLLKTWTRAALFSLVVLCIYFFFGSFQDFLMAQFKGSFITRYSFLLPAIFIIVLIKFIYFKKTKHSFEKLKLYLNTLILLLMLFDCINVLAKANKKARLTIASQAELPVCSDCPKPDIYFIITDGYSGSNALKKFYNYDNSAFENSLKDKGFFIADSSFSNYNYTVFSIGSMLNIDLLNIPGNYNGTKDIPVAFDAVRNNRIIDYFQKEGYRIYNYSIFDLKENPPIVKNRMLDFEKNPLKTQTFLYRVNKDLGYHLITTLGFTFLQSEAKKNSVADLGDMTIIDSLTKAASKAPATVPKFVYTHLVMPHWPYYYDSTGVRNTEEKLAKAMFANKTAYVSYLKYANNKLLDLIDKINSNTKGNAIIILVSDHACRECLETDPERGNAELQNISAVYFPNKNYSGFYKGISNVNLFRIVLNNQFNKKLPLLKDSLVLLKKEN